YACKSISKNQYLLGYVLGKTYSYRQLIRRARRHAQIPTANHLSATGDFPRGLRAPLLQPRRPRHGADPTGGELANPPVGGGDWSAAVRIRGQEALPDRGGRSAAGG